MIDSYKRELVSAISSINEKDIVSLAEKILETNASGRTTFIAGNGGSASTASHWQCDCAKGTLTDLCSEKRLRVLSLSDNIALMTAYANDFSYDEIFAQQLRTFSSKGDMLIAITGSGNSKNIIRAVDTAKEIGVYVFSLLGFDGGKALQKSDSHILINSRNYGIIEDMHLAIGHMVSQYILENWKNLV